RADVAAAAGGIAPPTVRILVPDQPTSADDAGGKRAAGPLSMPAGEVEREHGRAGRQRAARQIPIPMVARRSSIEQSISEQTQALIESRGIDGHHEGSRLRCPSARSA